MSTDCVIYLFLKKSSQFENSLVWSIFSNIFRLAASFLCNRIGNEMEFIQIYTAHGSDGNLNILIIQLMIECRVI